MRPPAALLQPLLEALGDPALVVDGNAVTAANSIALDLLGDAIVGRDVRIAIRHPHALDVILSGKSQSIDLVGIGAVDRPWRMTVAPIDASATLVRLYDRSETAAAERMRTDFVANASHELRTPLATLIGYGETLAEPGPLDDALRAKFGETIHHEARRMQRIVDDLMSLSRIEAGRFQAPSARVDMTEVVRASIQHAAGQAGRTGAAIHFDEPPEPLVVIGDSPQLAQVVDNLIANALRYGGTDSGCEVSVDLHRSSSRVMVTVADRGDGIDSEHLPRLTERFYRVDAARSRDSGGTGLGLAIVKHIVERHRGTLAIQSRRGEGTRVTVDLPAG